MDERDAARAGQPRRARRRRAARAAMPREAAAGDIDRAPQDRERAHEHLDARRLQVLASSPSIASTTSAR